MSIALQRLVLMAQGFEERVVAAFLSLPTELRFCLTEEFARTGLVDQFRGAPASLRSHAAGPAFMLYHAPAFLQQAETECLEALHVLGAVCRAARHLFPCLVESVELTATIRMDALLDKQPSSLLFGLRWYVCRTGKLSAKVIRCEPPEGKETALVDLTSLTLVRGASDCSLFLQD